MSIDHVACTGTGCSVNGAIGGSPNPPVSSTPPIVDTEGKNRNRIYSRDVDDYQASLGGCNVVPSAPSNSIGTAFFSYPVVYH